MERIRMYALHHYGIDQHEQENPWSAPLIETPDPLAIIRYVVAAKKHYRNPDREWTIEEYLADPDDFEFLDGSDFDSFTSWLERTFPPTQEQKNFQDRFERRCY